MKKRFSEEQIIGTLSRLASGTTAKDLSRELGVSQQEFFDLAERSEPGAHGVRFVPALTGSMAPRCTSAVSSRRPTA